MPAWIATKVHGMDITSVLNNYEQSKADTYNSTVGELTGLDCPGCKNKGSVAFVKDGNLTFRECSCMIKRRSQKHIEQSGLKNLLEDCTFANYQTPEKWNAEAKQKAQSFLTDHDGKWFLACGSVGGGKTHLCTAVCGEFFKYGQVGQVYALA